MTNYSTKIEKNSIAITPIIISDFDTWVKKQPKATQNWIKTTGFKAKNNSFCLIPDQNGKISEILLSLENKEDFWAFGALPPALKEGKYHIALNYPVDLMEHAAIAWGLGCYKFNKYKKDPRSTAQLFLPKNCNQKQIENIVKSICLTRDIIEYPNQDMGPAEFAKIATQIAKENKASVKQIIGNDLLKHNFPLIHAVGRASNKSPRLIEIHWHSKNKKAPKIALVGKGVCFDSGGVNLKPTGHIETMKKDLAGAAHVLGLAQMIMQAKLPVNLSVYMPLVENMLAGNSYKPGDIFKSRKGITVEISNTDAEGRLILADALALAAENKPDIIIDFASLTGAANVAVGPEIAALFSDNQEIADKILEISENEKEPIWQLPLHKPYRYMLDSKVADINNCAKGGYAGATTAALFLKEFVPNNIPWVHFDIMANNVRARAGRPEGGEAMALRTVFNYLKNHFTVKKP